MLIEHVTKFTVDTTASTSSSQSVLAATDSSGIPGRTSLTNSLLINRESWIPTRISNPAPVWAYFLTVNPDCKETKQV